MILICSAIFWTGLFALFFEGFHFLGTFVKLSTEIVEYLFAMFFLSLLIMLVFSTGIILYTSLFTSREAAYLHDPAHRQRPRLRLQVRRGHGLLLLGIPAAG